MHHVRPSDHRPESSDKPRRDLMAEHTLCEENVVATRITSRTLGDFHALRACRARRVCSQYSKHNAGDLSKCITETINRVDRTAPVGCWVKGGGNVENVQFTPPVDLVDVDPDSGSAPGFESLSFCEISRNLRMQ